MRPARDYACPFSGQPADHLHHAAGRGADGAYLDLLVMPLILRQHIVEHQCWERAGFGEALQLAPNVARLGRSGTLLARLGTHHGDGYVLVPAEFLRDLGRMQLRIARDLEDEQ